MVALVRAPDEAAALADQGVELVPGDVTRPGTFRDVLRSGGVDGVFHVAGWYRLGARSAAEAETVNVDGTRNVLEAAAEAGVARTVYTSTIAVFGDTAGRVVDEDYRHDGPWLSRYDRTKWRAHYEVALPLAAQGMPLVIVQPGLVIGAGDHSNVGVALRDYLRGRLPAIPVQGGCWAHVTDTARGHIQAMERGQPGSTYVIGGPPLMWEEALRLGHEITGVRPPRFRLPPALARATALLLRPVARVLPLPPTYHPETLRIAGGVTYFADDGRARRELGWAPLPPREALRLTLEGELARLRG
jgi:dihydroflavonol-4-reductase